MLCELYHYHNKAIMENKYTHQKKKNVCTYSISGQSNDTITRVTSGKLHQVLVGE